MKATPDPIDVHVGTQVRVRRVLAGISQETLGAALNVTFQQVQKYEKGTNRLSASALVRVARALGTEVADLLAGAPGGTTAGGGDRDFREMTRLLSDSDGIALVRAFGAIRDPRLRRRLVGLVRALANEDDDPGSDDPS